MFGEDVAEAEDSLAEVIVGACEVEDCEAHGIERGGGDGCYSGEIDQDIVLQSVSERVTRGWGVRERLLSSFRRMRARRDGKLFVRV